MSDIVERLRDWASNSTGCNPANAPCAEAADEIERLRARLAECERERDGVRRVATLRAMVIRDYRARAERLAAALREARTIVERWCHYQGNTPELFAQHLGPIDAALDSPEPQG